MTLPTAERRLWQAQSAGDAPAARAVVGEQLDLGVAGASVIVDLLAPAQRAAGVHWQSGQWTVGDEHAATAVVDAALAVIESGSVALRADGVVLAAACAESEWHSLPARMAAQLLRDSGAQVRFLGPSMPADHLREYLARLQPDALVLSATIATSLPGAARSIAAAHDTGVPVVAGGAAFGRDATRATRLGADMWLADAREFHASLLPPRLVPPATTLAWQPFLDLETRAGDLVAGAYCGLQLRLPMLRSMTDAQTARTQEDLRHILDFLAVSLLLGDSSILREFSGWLRQVVTARGVPWSAVEASYAALADELDATSGAMLTAALADEAGAA